MFQKSYVAPKNVDEAALENRGEYGDRAGEYFKIGHGRYSAWPYVVIAFGYQVAIIAAIVATSLIGLFHGQSEAVQGTLIAVGIGAGIAATWFVFRDRWRCIECYSSFACSGVMNLSLLYVPFVSLVYANVRGFRKLRGR
jgi:hypothetical protein